VKRTGKEDAKVAVRYGVKNPPSTAPKARRKPLAPEWKPLAGIGRSGTGRLLAALLTTYDPPDPSVLIEHYLPQWLGLENTYVDETDDRLRYFAELEDGLRRVKGRIAIVSSTGDAPACAEGWIWNYIARFQVGATGAAVQHAKLWMFHYDAVEADAPQTLEIVVSSANLTQPGLRSQIQSGWRCTVPLLPAGSNAREKSWGCLANFLTELGQASGAGCPRVIAEWRELLRRSACPEGVEFVASVAGKHSTATLRTRDTAWGVTGLANLWLGKHPRQVTALTPTFGHWDREGFEEWCEAAGVAPHNVASAWVGCDHPWADHWQLDASSERALSDAGMQWREISVPEGSGSPLCDEHKKEDSRWSHAKLYELREGAQRRLLVTSANFSQSAWGRRDKDGKLEIGNFEFGVVFPVRDAFRGQLGQNEFVRHTCAVDYSRDAEAPIGWLAAEWDGRKLRIGCRAPCPLETRVKITVARVDGTTKHAVKWATGMPAQASLTWPEATGDIPIAVTVTTTKGDSRTITIHDTRTSDDGRLLCPEYDEARLREAADILLEEKYGYARVPGESDGKGKGNGARNGAAGDGGYAVDAYVDARRRFRFVDNWWTALKSADENSRELIIRDGRQIGERWKRSGECAPSLGERVAARVAADEIQLRIGRIK